MRINNLHISAFGKLQNVTMTFRPGMNLLLGDNEYGKSTMLSFIRAMFYGFSRKNLSRMRDNDRLKFAPWNKTSFGGSIEFQISGKTYLLEKTFSKRKSDDKAVLTMLPSGQRVDLAAKEAGEYLFGISEGEFVNTIFVGQLMSNILSTDTQKDDISARLANLADTGNELFSHDEIKARLVAASSKLRALRGQGGLIPKLEEELVDLGRKERELEASEAQTEALRGEIADDYRNQQSMRDSLTQTSVRLEAIKSKKDEVAAYLLQQEILLQTAVEKNRLELKQVSVKEDMERLRKENQLDREKMRKNLAEECARSEDEINRLILLDQKEREHAESLAADMDALIRRQEVQWNENKALYENKVKETENLEEDILTGSSELKALIQMREEIRRGLTTIIAYKLKARRYGVLFLSAFAVSVIASALMQDPTLLAGTVFLILASVLFVSNRIQLRRIEKTIVEKSKAHEARLIVFESASATVYDGRTELDECVRKLDEMRIQKARMQEDERKDEKFRMQMLAMNRDRLADSYARSARFSEDSETSALADAPDTDVSDTSALADVPDIIAPDISAPGTAAPVSSNRPRTIEEEKPVDIPAAVSQIETARLQQEQLKEEISRIVNWQQQQGKALNDNLIDTARKETVRENLLAQAPDRSELLEKREILTERLGEARDYCHALITAQKVLDEAFSKMENFFAPQVNQKAGEYLAKLTKGMYTTLHVDRTFGIDIATDGDYSFQKADYFSAGTVDQVYFALRLAITDLVQTAEDKMPLLLDDAFVQYDDKRAKAGLTLLDELSLSRQIILFSCHGRMRDLYEEVERNKGKE